MEKKYIGSPFMNIDFKIQNKYISKYFHSNWIFFGQETKYVLISRVYCCVLMTDALMPLPTLKYIPVRN